MSKDNENVEKSNNDGWILLHRRIKNHWLWKSDRRFKWWIDILLEVNHTDAKVPIGNHLVECKRGQSLRSLASWAKDWNVSKHAVKDFFELLKNDSMLVSESVQITTRITVCNYDNYQIGGNGAKSKRERNGNGQGTGKKLSVNGLGAERERTGNGQGTRRESNKEGLKEYKNIDERENDFKEQLKLFELKYEKEMLFEFYRHWSEKTRDSKYMLFELKPTWELAKRLSTWKRNESKYTPFLDKSKPYYESPTKVL